MSDRPPPPPPPPSPIRIVVTTHDAGAPFDIDAIILEDDTWNVLSAEPEARAMPGSLGPLWSEASQTEPKPPGSVHLSSADPPRLLAIVHDLELEPSWREEWIAGALHEAIRIIEERGLISIALETLGTKHGALPAHRFCELLASVLRDAKLSRLRRIWLITNPGTDRYAFKALEDHDLELVL